MILKGIDETLNSRMASRFIGAEGCRLLRAQRKYWATVDEAQVAVLLSLTNAEPYRELPEGDTEKKA